MIHSFLLVGQSNMAGRGFKEDVEPIKNPNVKILRNGWWINSYVPVNPDRAFSGVSLAESFADLYSKDHEGVTVGLIPCADGGSDLDCWEVGGLLFDNAIYQARLASRTSNIVGILWHQGESDSDKVKSLVYEEKFRKIIAGFRNEPVLKDLPFVVGELGEYLKDYAIPERMECFRQVNEKIYKVATTTEKMAFVSSKGLTDNGDNLHFNAKSLRELGVRYYEAFKTIEEKDRVFEEKPSERGAIRTGMALL